MDYLGGGVFFGDCLILSVLLPYDIFDDIGINGVLSLRIGIGLTRD